MSKLTFVLYIIDKLCCLGPLIAGVFMLGAVSGIHGEASGPDLWIIWPIGIACVWIGLRTLARWPKSDKSFEYFL